MSNNKQSSVEWLDDKLAILNFDYLTGQIGNKEYNERHKAILEQAKEMEKEQHSKTWNNALEAFEKKLELLKQTYGGNK